ncbi:hypothetical protein ABZS86_32450 [Streptomyces sp. NPDC005355]|uniref:hypothetical protein n=1 Tax=Streptomyces sp. NPDC005355 TaxID=3157038 RepID=UPI0033BD747A
MPDDLMESDKIKNDRGVIAENYHELQSIGAIEAARASMTVPGATPEALLIGLYQSSEIAMYNVADLLTRAGADLASGDVDACAIKLLWTRSFHRLLVRLSGDALRISSDWSATAPRWPLQDTPAFAEFTTALESFDGSLAELVDRGELDVRTAISEASLTDSAYTILHCVRVVNHDARVWATNLARAVHPQPAEALEAALASSHLRHAVHEHHLVGDTYFTQFRALHQIPELLVREINDRLELATKALRDGDDARALELLDGAASLYPAIEASLPPIVDNLSTFDYHQIRENLGMTSGSHSVAMRFHLFTDLYEQFAQQVMALEDAAPDGSGVARLRRHVADLRVFIFSWRDMHLHLPRNNLGGTQTKSLTGAPDAVRTVQKMRDSAASADPTRSKTRDRPAAVAGPLDGYLDGPKSSDQLLLSITGEVTQANFRDVQERLNFFSQRPSFTRPPRREV